MGLATAFGDGNGRVGRLLLAAMVEEWCQLSSQWLYMSDFFDRNKDSYIDLLLAVSTDGRWEDWIEFCLSGVVEQAHDTMMRCERLIALNRDFHERVSEVRGSVRLARMVDQLFISPVVIAAAAKRTYNVTYPTVRSDIDKLVRLGILVEIEDAGKKSYYSPPIYEATFAD